MANFILLKHKKQQVKKKKDKKLKKEISKQEDGIKSWVLFWVA
jgi:hypothetical protein